VPIAQVQHVCDLWKRQADDVIDRVRAGLGDPARAEQLEQAYRREVRPYLQTAWPRPRPLRGPGGQERTVLDELLPEAPAAVKADLQQVRDLCLGRRQLLSQQRRHWWLHSWLLLHVPLAVVLLCLGVVHALVA